MTREQVKEIMPYIQAFVDGKTVQRQVKDSDENKWIDMVDVLTFSTQTFNYRIKPEPTYRPFKSAEECWQEMQKHQPFGWVKDKNTGIYKLMTLIGNGEYDYVVGIECGFSLERIFEYYTFADGTPFGMENVIKEEKL